MNVPLFLIPILVGLATQFSKRFFNRRYLSAIKLQGLPLPRYGGMPSAHAAFSFSLLTTVGMVDGVTSTTFAITCAATIFILDDALRMRIFLGRHGEVLRRLINKLPPEDSKGLPQLEVRLGHKPLEVAVGAAVGVIMTYLLLLLIL